MRKCRVCLHEIPDTARICPQCGEDLIHGRRPTDVPAKPTASAVPPSIVATTKKCPFCAEDIQAAAIVCKHCGRDLIAGRATAAAPRAVVMQPAWSPGVAAVLSLIIPGAGQMYKGQVLGGLVWLVAVVIGYVALVVPGLVLHVCCIIAAASGTPPQIQAA